MNERFICLLTFILKPAYLFERYERGVMEEVVDAHETGECVFSAQASARASRVITQKKNIV